MLMGNHGWYGTVWAGMEWYGLVWNGMVWKDLLQVKWAERLMLPAETGAHPIHYHLPAYQGIDLQAGKEEGRPELSPVEEQLVLAS